MSTAVQSTGGDGPASAFPPELAEHVLRNAPALIACIDTELRFRYVNDTHRRWFGTDPAQLIWRRIRAPATKGIRRWRGLCSHTHRNRTYKDAK